MLRIAFGFNGLHSGYADGSRRAFRLPSLGDGPAGLYELDSNERKALIEFLNLATADVEAGKQNFSCFGCVGCHGLQVQRGEVQSLYLWSLQPKKDTTWQAQFLAGDVNAVRVFL
jgi:hypothetical protein